jgi:hypothetical protein
MGLPKMVPGVFTEGPRPEDYETRKPSQEIVWKDRTVLGILTCNYYGTDSNSLPNSVTCVSRNPRLRLLYKGESRDKERIDSIVNITLVFLAVEYFSG